MKLAPLVLLQSTSATGLQSCGRGASSGVGDPSESRKRAPHPSRINTPLMEVAAHWTSHTSALHQRGSSVGVDGWVTGHGAGTLGEPAENTHPGRRRLVVGQVRRVRG
ncbi:hypothetical protein HPB47_016479 [Ixodes persulcatus]|uniref:Uncharacterized protein n=1 Tax=Ixodes persulcatus TaxID=34615 RepID=A0AC60QQV5_IXOPE|nr:hypothetical protein HPB47_016479 [Ixodes persulcatus]